MMIIKCRLKPATTYGCLANSLANSVDTDYQKEQLVLSLNCLPFWVAVDRPNPKSRVFKLEPRYHIVAFRVLVSNANPSQYLFW